ncbi:MAG: GH116 family glycosyl hydrolase, partial [Candidatus Acidiferrales bacterium]
VKFWPQIDKQVLRQFADTVPRDLPEKALWLWKSQQLHDRFFRIRKKQGAVPHDLGIPEEDPFFSVNQFSWQDTNGWGARQQRGIFEKRA